jgi:hypothetical protein
VTFIPHKHAAVQSPSSQIVLEVLLVVISVVLPGNTHKCTSNPSRVDGQADHDLWVAVSPFLAMPAFAHHGDIVCLPRFPMVIFFIGLKVERRRIPDDYVHISVA